MLTDVAIAIITGFGPLVLFYALFRWMLATQSPEVGEKVAEQIINRWVDKAREERR